MSSSPVSQDYEILDRITADGDIPITVYRNKVTDLRVVTVHAESPIVYGDFFLATEAFDDDGLPHTLEHLIFLGSEEYPYKGVLDLLANKSMASGTNAWTDTDNTNYTISTAGSDGFLQLLPIYLDHILFPNLKDSAYVTEVHHINGEGEDAGIVYCEMQACENTGEYRCYQEMLRELYPGKCGYKSMTGGLMENLRTSTNNTKVRNYHKEFYHTKNLCILVTGPVDPLEIFKAIKPLEDKVVAKGLDKIKFTRPWQTPIKLPDASSKRTIQYPCDTDDDGLVYIGFHGPDLMIDYSQLISLSMILEYLDATAISPLQRDFVECDEPYCSSISHNIIESTTACFYFEFESVGKQYLNLVVGKFFSLLGNIVSGKEKLDLDRLKVIISRRIVRMLAEAETSPHAATRGAIIGDFLYGSSNLKQRVQVIPVLEKIKTHEARYWLDLIERYMTGPNERHVCIIGEPSPKLMQTMAEEEKARVAKQKERLGAELPLIAEKLKLSIAENEIPPPETIFNCLQAPSTDNIKFHSIERYVLDPKLTPFRFQFDSIKTNFISIYLLMNTSDCLSKADRLYLPLLSEIILECPVERDGQIIPYEQVVAELFSDTICHGCGIGLGGSSYGTGSISMLFNISMEVEISKYEKAIKWYSEILYNTIFTPERIKTTATRMFSDISQFKRSGSKVTQSAMCGLIYNSNSNQWASNFMRQQKFLKKLLKDIKSDPRSVQDKLTKVRDVINRPDKIVVHIALDKNKVDTGKLHEPWQKMIPEEIMSSLSKKQHLEYSEVTPCHQLTGFSDMKSVIVGLGSVETNCMYQVIPSINSLTHPDLPALYVLINYLEQLEGPLWKSIRGLGLSYHFSIRIQPSDGLMWFVLQKSSQLVAAYDKADETIRKHLTGKEDYTDNLLESAKSSLIYEFIKKEKSAANRSLQSLVSYIRNTDMDFNKEMIRKMAKVTKDDLRRVGPLYLKPLFEDPNKRVAVCCNSSKIDELARGFENKFHLKLINLEEEPSMNSLD